MLLAFFCSVQDAIQAQMVIQKMSELGMSDSNLAMDQSDEALGTISEQPLYANVNEEDDANANMTLTRVSTTTSGGADRENNSIPVSGRRRHF